MNEIDFTKANWANQYADGIIRVVTIVIAGVRHYTITVGTEVVADKVTDEDPRVTFALKIAAQLPAKIAHVAEKARQQANPPAFRMDRGEQPPQNG